MSWNEKKAIVLENFVFVLENTKNVKKIIKIIFFCIIKKNVDFISLFAILYNFHPIWAYNLWLCVRHFSNLC
jgi:hypothetical protein